MSERQDKRNWTTEYMINEITEYSDYKKQLTKDTASVHIIGGACPHVRVYTTREGGMRAAYRIANNISDLADAVVVDNTKNKAPNGWKQPKQSEFYNEAQAKPEQAAERFVVFLEQKGRSFLLCKDGTVRVASALSSEDAHLVAIFDTKSKAKRAMDKLTDPGKRWVHKV